MAASILSFPPRSSNPALSPEQPEQPEQPGAPRKVSLEDGYTRLADALLDELMQTKYKLSGREYAVLLVVMRKTFGFGKSSDWIALSQFEQSTGIEKSNCRKVILSLVEKKILTRQANGNDQHLGINTNVSDWVCTPIKPRGKRSNNHQKKAWSNSTGIRSDLTTSESDLTISESDLTPTIDNKQINNLKDNVPAASQPETADVDQPVLVSPDQPVDQPIDQPAGQLAEPIAERRVAKEPDSKPKSRKRTLTFDPADREFAEYMLTQIEGVNGSQGKTNLDQWANDIRLMRTQDGHTPEQISQLFQFANTHPINSGGFTWSAVIRSPAKLRKKWGDLMAQYRTQQRFNASPITSGTNHHENRSATGQPHHHTHDHTHQTREDYLNDISWMPEHLL